MSSIRSWTLVYRVKCEKAPRKLDMGCAGPWSWEHVRDQLILSVYGYHKSSKMVDYKLSFSTPNSELDAEAWPNKLYIVTRSPSYDLNERLYVDLHANAVRKRRNPTKRCYNGVYNNRRHGMLLGLHPPKI